jgi:hypothetical protein
MNEWVGFSPTLNWLALEEIVRIKKQDYLTLLLETSTSDFCSLQQVQPQNQNCRQQTSMFY